jgi:hypothetical protein
LVKLGIQLPLLCLEERPFANPSCLIPSSSDSMRGRCLIRGIGSIMQRLSILLNRSGRIGCLPERSAVVDRCGGDAPTLQIPRPTR